MADYRVNCAWPLHPKRVKLQRRLGAEAVLALMDLWGFSAESRPTGALTGMSTEDIAIAAGYSGDADRWVEALVDVGLLLKQRGGVYVLKDWEEHNPYAASKPARSAAGKRAADIRWGNRLGTAEHSGATSAAVPSDANRMPAASPGMPAVQNRSTPSPDPIPSPVPTPKISPASPSDFEVANRIWLAQDDDEHRGKLRLSGIHAPRLPANPQTVARVVKQLARGYSEAQLMHVLAVFSAEAMALHRADYFNGVINWSDDQVDAALATTPERAAERARAKAGRRSGRPPGVPSAQRFYQHTGTETYQEGKLT